MLLKNKDLFLLNQLEIYYVILQRMIPKMYHLIILG